MPGLEDGTFRLEFASAYAIRARSLNFSDRSFGVQVLARSKEFGLLLSLAVSVVQVHVMNPQSFHWSMDLRVQAGRRLGLCTAAVLTAWVTGCAAVAKDAVLAAKEDW